MPQPRMEENFSRSSFTSAGQVDIETYDRGGRFTTDANVTIAGATGANVNFVFAEDGATGSAVSVIHRGKGGVMGLRLQGTGSKGNKIEVMPDGRFHASPTAESAVAASSDIAVALEDWTDGENTSCYIFGGN